MQGTIKGLQWKLLYGNHRSELEEGGWERLARETGGPADVKVLPLEADVPAGPFNEALSFLDRELGQGDGAHQREIAARSIRRWASMYRSLVAEFDGRPGPLVELFCQEVHPWFVNRRQGAQLVERGPERAVVRFDDPLPDPFRAGLLDGVVSLTSVDGRVTRVGPGRFEVTWSAERARTEGVASLFLRATRLQFLPATLLPVLLGGALALWAGALDPVVLAAAAVAATALHLSANALDDVVDHLRGVDRANLTPTPFSGGSRTIQLGLLGWKAMARLAAALGVVGVGIGLYLVAATGPALLVLGAVGVGLAYAYAGPPFRLAHRGLGGLTTGLVFGPLVTAGALMVQDGPWTTGLAAGLPLGLFWAASALVNEVPDAPWDARTGKRTLAVRLDDRVPAGLGLLLGGGYVATAALVAAGTLPLPALAALATVPLAVAVVRALDRHRADPEALVAVQARALVLHTATGVLLVAATAAGVLL